MKKKKLIRLLKRTRESLVTKMGDSSTRLEMRLQKGVWSEIISGEPHHLSECLLRVKKVKNLVEGEKKNV